jgi:hypothetical protein
MTFRRADRVAGTSTTTGTGNITVGALPLTGFITFSAIPNIATNDTFPYCIADQSGSNWEAGIATWNGANVFARTIVTSNSSGTTALINFTSGALNCWLDNPAITTGVTRGSLAGLTLSNDGTSPNTVLDVAAGQCADSNGYVYINLPTFTKSTAGPWASGSGFNGMGSGLTIAASTWYHVFAIINSGVADVYFDTSVTAANAPSSTIAYRRIGSFLTDSSSHILAFVQDEDTFYWSANPQPLDISTTTLGTTSALYTLSTPLGVKTRPIIRTMSNNNATITSSPDQPDSSVTASAASCQMDSDGYYGPSPRVDIYTNTLSQIRVRASASSTSYYARTLGYIDSRGIYS